MKPATMKISDGQVDNIVHGNRIDVMAPTQRGLRGRGSTVLCTEVLPTVEPSLSPFVLEALKWRCSTWTTRVLQGTLAIHDVGVTAGIEGALVLEQDLYRGS